MSVLLALAAVALAATAGVRLCATSNAATYGTAPPRLVKGGPRYFENPLIQWRRGLIDPPLYRSAHAPRGRR